MSSTHTQDLNPLDFELPMGARWLRGLLERLQLGQLQLVFDDGRTLDFTSPRPELHARWHLHHPARLFTRVARLGDVGFAEGYIEGDWSSPDLTNLIEIAARNFELMRDDLRASFWARLGHRLQHWLRANHRRGSRRNIAAHYDLGNDFYRLWLDETMTYSAAWFEDPEQPLARAQDAKYERLLDLLDAEPGQTLLEIGCGWGGMAEHAARRALDVTAITLSREQHHFALERIASSGLSDRARIRLVDYRDVDGQFDRIVSIEMFEAVGERYWPTYFRNVHDRLAPGGRAAIQVITIDESVFEEYRREPDFIQLYIFPGGMLPTPTEFSRQAEQAGLVVRDRTFFGPAYAHTLMHWRHQFERQADNLAALGYDERFQRMWRYYLAYCEAGFNAGRIDVMQVLLEKPA
ncbi:MAG: class I SAM-dependent methyltransferase [Halothiobacillaceae bacterium]